MEALGRQIKVPDAVIFLGDGLRDIEYAELDGISAYCVRGNCDSTVFSTAFAPDEHIITLGSKKIFITHGHRYGVKGLLSPLINRARELGADVALFGHTHEPFEKHIGIENEYGIALDKPLWLMNPGSIGSYPYCFGCMEINSRGEILLSHGTLL